jgi:hypothetical protein
MCNILIYFCNIRVKHLQRTTETSETLETYACNMRFQHNITLLLERWRIVVAELDASVEVGSDVWSSWRRGGH